MFFLRYLAKTTHLELLSDEDFKKLTKDIPAALNVLYRNAKENVNVSTLIGKLHFFQRNLVVLRKKISYFRMILLLKQ